jgi:surface carbohydrate biosynthesis protein (TIGR04326 family)
MNSYINIFLKSNTNIKFLWNDVYSQSNEFSPFKVVSLPHEVEKNSIDLKHRYLSFVDKLSHQVVEGFSLIDNFKLREDFSFWWMTDFQEKQHYGKKSPIYSVLRLMILDDFLSNEKENIEKIIICHIDDYFVCEILKDWASSNNVLVSDSFKLFKKTNFFNSFYIFFNIIYSIISIFFVYIKNIRLKNESIDKAYNISFWGYLLNFNGLISEKSGFKSQYWNNLVKHLEDKNLNVNWMHFWLKSSTPSSISLEQSLAEVRNYMLKYTGSFHYIINLKFPSSLIIKTYIDFFKLIKLVFIIDKISFFENSGELNYKYAYAPMFYKDITSGQGLWKILYFNLFDSLLAKMPFQSLGFYLQENNSWEFAFLYAWKKHKHGEIIGIPHTTIRFWDLRYFSSDNNLLTNFEKPLPNKIGVNSIYAKNSLNSYTHKNVDLIELEALRFSYLGRTKKVRSNKKLKSKLVLLIAGDYDVYSTNNLIKLLFSLNEKTLNKFEILFKSHPGFHDNSILDIKSHNFQIVNEQFGDLLSLSDVLCTTNSTTAAVEGFCYGMKVLIHFSSESLNMSPLKGFSDVNFFSNQFSLESLLNEIYENQFHSENKNLGSNDYFFLDEKLEKWDGVIRNHFIQNIAIFFLLFIFF